MIPFLSGQPSPTHIGLPHNTTQPFPTFLTTSAFNFPTACHPELHHKCNSAIRITSAMRRSSSFPSITSSHEPRRRPNPIAFLSELRLSRRQPRPRPPSHDLISPPRESFADYVRDEMNPIIGTGLDSVLMTPAANQLVATDGPLLLPFARRNLCLKFLQLDIDGKCTPRTATRHEILREVRQNWNPGFDPGSQRLPRRHKSVREDGEEERMERGKQVRHARGRLGRDRRGIGIHTGAGYVSGATGGSHRSGGGNRLTVRDMRQIDPAFTAKPAIWVREDAMVVSLEGVRAIILHNKMFVFDADNDTVQTPVGFIRKRLVNNVEDVFLPFEFRALEGILIYTCAVLERAFLGIEPGLRRTLLNLPEQVNSEQLEQLRVLEQRLNHYYSRAKKVQSALQSVLDEDEDMADMYLSEKRRNPDMDRNPVDHDEAEMLLETYLQNVDDLTSRAGLLNQAIDDTENLIEIHLDTMQNRLLLVDLIITVFSTILSFGTMVTAIFGMNFPLPGMMGMLPGSQYYFYGCVGLMFTFMSIVLVVLTRWCKQQGIYRGRTHGPGRKKKRKQGNVVGRANEDMRRQTESLLSKQIGAGLISEMFE